VRHALPICTAVVLAFAILAKVWAEVSGRAAIDAVPAWRYLAAAHILFESVLLAWIVGGWWQPWLRRCCAVVFAVFAAVAAQRWYAGEVSCGCFGAIQVPPAATVALDAVLCLAWLRRTSEAGRPRLGLALAALGLCLAGAVLAPWSLPSRDLASTAPDPALLHGHWIVVAYRTDCSHCRRDFPAWLAEARRQTRRRPLFGPAAPAPRWAFARVGAREQTDDLWPGEGSGEGFLRIDWPKLDVTTTPLGIELRDGLVFGTTVRPWR